MRPSTNDTFSTPDLIAATALSTFRDHALVHDAGGFEAGTSVVYKCAMSVARDLSDRA